MRELSTRSVLITRAEADKTTGERIIEGRAVPYGEWTTLLPGIREQFTADAVETDDQPPKLFWQHRDPIGPIPELRHEPDGCYITARISNTACGDDAWALVQDGVIDRLSVGFVPIEQTETPTDDGVDIVVTRALLREVSLVTFPAYPTAQLTDHRSAPERTTMTTTADTVTRADIEALTRQVEAIAANTTTPTDDTASAIAQFRSLGEYVAGLAAGDEHAKRAFEGATTTELGDTLKPAWLGMLEQDMKAKQPVLNLFTHTHDLPAKGMSVEYAWLDEDTTKVAKQAAQGEQLPHGKITLKTATAQVSTYGGWTSVAKQVVDRSSIDYLTMTFAAMARRYARVMEADFRSVLEPVITAAVAAPAVTADPLTMTATDWVSAIVDLADAYDDSDWALDGLLVSPDVFKALAELPEQRTALQLVGAPDDKQGTLELSAPSGKIANLTVARFPKATTTFATGFARSAAVCKESPGAPLRLQDEDITTLVNQYSIYGYAAQYVTGPSAFKAIAAGA